MSEKHSPGDALCALAAAHGIMLAYHDVRGRYCEASDSTLRALLTAMHVDVSSANAIRRSLDAARSEVPEERLPALTVVRTHARPWRVHTRLHRGIAARNPSWRIRTEDGTEEECRLAPQHIEFPEAGGGGEPGTTLVLQVPVELPEGYHTLTLLGDGEPVATGTLAVAPARCYRPPSLRDGGRAWGLSAQLYGLRSAGNWGIGDFTDLGNLGAAAGADGADFVGVNPLHALFPERPAHASPYSPSSRLFLNVLYIDVEAVPEFTDCPVAQAGTQAPTFKAALASLRDADLVDHAGVAALKLPVLEALFAKACRDAEAAPTAASLAFAAFKRAGGESLYRHALFDALQAHLRARDAGVWGWPAWPAELRDPAASAVLEFARDHAHEVEFYLWLQWQAAVQRAAAAARARAGGLRIGLYTDLAVSIDRGGAESWAEQDLYAVAASVGAPPDIFNPRGQDWGLPPLIPHRLREAGYQPFIDTLRANMRDAGALRIDHIMALHRLYWVPPGTAASEGAYVRYPFEDLLGILALESQRHRCIVIGEDLGTVPDEVRAALEANDILSYRVLWFEREGDGSFKPPSAYPEAALAVVSTHDLPTLAGWWNGDDIRLRESLFPAAGTSIEALLDERAQDRHRLLDALRRAGQLRDSPGNVPPDRSAMTPALADAIEAFLATVPCTLMAVQLEDIFAVREQANLPGTIDEHPNWRRKLPLAVEAMRNDASWRALVAGLRAARGRRTP